MIRQLLQRVVHETGNGRALANARRAAEDDRFLHERIEALVRSLPSPAARPQPADDRGAA